MEEDVVQRWNRGDSGSLYSDLQGNPGKYYDVIGALRDGALKTWRVNQHKKEIKAGERVIIWVTGENSGCYGLATIMSEVQPSEEDAKEASYRIKPTENGASEGVTIRIDKNLWNTPVSEQKLMLCLGDRFSRRVGKEQT